MILRPYMLHPEWLGSDRVVGLRDHVKLFFLKIGNVTDGAGRFEADAALLRAALYPKELHKVSERDVTGMLETLHRAGLVRLYTRAGKGFGEVVKYKQTDSMRKVRYPSPDGGERELNFAVEAEVDPPPVEPPEEELNRRGGKRRAAPKKPPAPTSDQSAPESHEAWLARIQAAWTHVDVRAELAKAVIEKGKRGGQLERDWFERSWLPKCSVVITRADVFAAKASGVAGGEVIPPEGPENWKRALEDTALGEQVWADGLQWSDLNEGQKNFVVKRLEKRKASA